MVEEQAHCCWPPPAPGARAATPPVRLRHPSKRERVSGPGLGCRSYPAKALDDSPWLSKAGSNTIKL